jgi:pimeloyl-ACP methyl ester carboxylesterase
VELTKKTVHIIDVNGLVTSYRESNPSASQTILMLRGFRTSDRGLLVLARKFSSYHLIIPDLPGYGQTQELPGGNTIPAYAEFVDRFCDLLDLHDVTILGHSLGAHVGLAYVARHPRRVKNLVLISPIPRPNMVSRAVSLYYQIGRALPSPLEHGWLTNRKVHQTIRKFVVRTNDPVLREQIMREGERELKDLRPNVNVENFLSLVSTDPEFYIPHLSVPTLVLAGDLDRLTRLSDVISAYQHPLIELRVIRGMGHYGPSEIPEEISTIVMSWLQRESIPLASPVMELPMAAAL